MSFRILEINLVWSGDKKLAIFKKIFKAKYFFKSRGKNKPSLKIPDFSFFSRIQ